MSDTLAEKFLQDGFVVLEDFLNEEEVKELRQAGEVLAENIPDNHIHIFKSGEDKRKDQYFLDSSDKISYFYEASAIENGNICSNINGNAGTGETDIYKNLLNKVGHALHKHHPVFQRIAASTPVREICYRLGLEDPVIAQSMYIYKNPKIGGEVLPHQDASYLYAEPPSALVGFWIALDDATTKNGCLWFASGSHKSGVHRRLVRSKENATDSNDVQLIYDAPAPSYPASIFRPVPVKKGLSLICSLINSTSIMNYVKISQEMKDVRLSQENMWMKVRLSIVRSYPEEHWVRISNRQWISSPSTCIVIHGLVLHRSEANTSNDPRHAFTFHVLDQKGSKYSPDNWLQLPEGESFMSLYGNKQNSSTS